MDTRKAEIVVVGGVLIEPERINKVIEKVDIEAFSSPLNDILWGVLHIMSGESEQFKRVTASGIYEVIKHRNKRITRESIGEYANTISSDEEFEDNLMIVADGTIRSELSGDVERVGSMVSAGELLPDIVASLDSIRSDVTRKIERLLPGKSVSETIEQVKERIRVVHSMHGALTGVPSGFPRFDYFTGGFQHEFILIAARPSMGKTAFSLQVALNNALYYNNSCGFYSYEMSERDLFMRVICAESNVSFQDFKRGLITDSDVDRMMIVADRLKHVNMFIDDSIYPLEVLLSKIETAKRERGITMAIIDYIGLIPMRPDRNRSRQQEVSDISAALKQLSKRLSMPIVAISQLSRVSARKGGKPPALDELRESGALEQDADLVVFIHRPYYYGVKEVAGRDMRNVAEIIIAKQRNGPIGTAELVWDGRSARFANPAKRWVSVNRALL